MKQSSDSGAVEVPQTSLQEMIANEKMKAVTMKKIIPCTSVDVFNMLQDLRHFAVLDLRTPEEFDEMFLRDSFNFRTNQKNSWFGVVEHLKKSESRAMENEKKYSTKKIRRVCVIPQQESQSTPEQDFEMVKDIFKSNDIDVDKVYVLADKLTVLAQKFPFLMMNKEHKDAVLKLNGASKEELTQMVQPTNADQGIKRLLYSLSRFPFCIVEDRMFLGQMYNMNNKLQLQDLKIKTLVHIEVHEFEKGSESPEESKVEVIPDWDHGRTLIKIKLNSQKFIEFDSINQTLMEAEGPILICDSLSMRVASCLAIVYLMNLNKVDCNKASLQIFSKVGSTDADKLIYSQVMMYKVGDNGKFKKF